MRQNRFALVLAWIGAIALALMPVSTVAFDVKPSDSALQSKEFFRPELYVSVTNVHSAELLERLPNREAWNRMFEALGSGTQIYFDPRSGTPSGVVTSIPMIPGNGSGNHVTAEDVRRTLGSNFESINSKVVADLVSKFIVRNREAIAIDTRQMGPVRAAQANQDLWHVRIPQEVNGVPVRYAHMVANISHGNLVLFGTEMWGNVKIDTRPQITPDQAVELAYAYAGGKGIGDEIWKKPMLEIVPFAPPEYRAGEGFAGPPGSGYGHYLVWAFGFRQKDDQANWEVLVDAHKGQVIAFQDMNHYDTKQITGGVYPLTNTEICPTNDTCGVMQSGQPMPYANTGFASPNDFTNAAGLYEYSGGTLATTLSGKFVRITDTCGAISESSATGGLDLGGVNGQHDCTSAGTSPGDTPASRAAFYEVNKIVENAKGWLPGNAWLAAQMPTNVNLNQTCNAFYSTANGSINFYRSGGGCRNTGEIAAVFDHEWGHALDDNDTGGALSNSSEAYADIASIYRLRASCVGFGFLWTTNPGCGATTDGTGFNYNESQTGTHCILNCSGVRDSDWARHADGLPDTALGYVCTHCSASSGPCGRQVHCAAAPSRQAAWDLPTRDLQAAPFNMTREDAFNLATRIFYQGSGNIGTWHSCTCGGTADGCGATNGYMQWLTADDDDGNLANGTPHMTAIFAAFDRHGIACAAPAPTNSGCAGAPTAAPVLTPSIGNNQIGLSWTSVPGASTYRVMRTEGYARCDFGKSVLAEVPGTSYTDNSVANDRPYYYVVQALGASAACAGPGSDCATATPQPCAGAVSADRGLYNCTDVLNLSLVDSDLTGAGTQSVEVTSSVEATAEIVVLNEAPPGSGKFAGTIATTSAPPAADGLISVADAGTVSIRYVDLSFCGTPNVNVDRNVSIDCSGPVITNVRAENVSGNSADIKWDTNEVATSFASYGNTPPPGTTTPTNPALVTAHTIRVTGLTECSPYVFSVGSTDPAANLAVADNSGAYFSFETGRNVNPTYTSPDPPVPAPPGGGTSSPIPGIVQVVVTDDKPLLDVDVRFNMTHSYDGDNIVSLRHPDGTVVTLSNRRGGGGDNFVDAVFDDEATGPISGGAAPFTGSFTPDTPLAALDGKSSAGTWNLEVLDNIGGDSGTINGFDLILTYPGESCGPDCDQSSVARLSDTCVSGSGGSGNGRWDDGEQAVLQVTLANVGSVDLTGVSATLSPITAGVVLLDATATYPDIPRATSAVSDAPYFTARLDEGFPCGAPVEFQVTITTAEGTFNDTFQAGTAGESFPGGIATAMLEDFAAGIPGDWSVVDGGSGGGAAATWTTANPGARASSAPITTPFAIVDSDNAGDTSTQDEQLITRVLNLSIATSVTLEFDQYFRFAPLFGDEKGDVDVRSSVTGGAWVNVLRNQIVSSPNPEHKTIDITAQAAGAADAQIRFHYYGGAFDWYWMVDNVKVTHPALAYCTIVNCDVAEPPLEVVQMQFDDKTTASWTSAVGATSYNLYRGADFELPKLFTGETDSCLRTTTGSLSASGITETPATDAFDWWLVRAANGFGVGPAGNGSAGPRVHDSGGICP